MAGCGDDVRWQAVLILSDDREALSDDWLWRGCVRWQTLLGSRLWSGCVRWQAVERLCRMAGRGVAVLDGRLWRGHV